MPTEWDYTEELWDYRGDGYVKVERFGKVIYERPAIPLWACELCGEPYRHFFVPNAEWATVPEEHRKLKLCPRCYAGA